MNTDEILSRLTASNDKVRIFGAINGADKVELSDTPMLASDAQISVAAIRAIDPEATFTIIRWEA